MEKYLQQIWQIITNAANDQNLTEEDYCSLLVELAKEAQLRAGATLDSMQ